MYSAPNLQYLRTPRIIPPDQMSKPIPQLHTLSTYEFIKHIFKLDIHVGTVCINLIFKISSLSKPIAL